MLDEARMVVEQPQLLELRGIGSDELPGPLEVLPVLAAARVGAEGRGGEDEGPLDPVLGHRGHGVGDHRVPVAVAPVDRQVDAGVGQLTLQGGDQLPAVVVDGGAAAELLVLLGHLGQALVRDVAAPGHVAEEGEDVIWLLGPAEGQHEDGVEGGGGHGGMLAAGSATGRGDPAGGIAEPETTGGRRAQESRRAGTGACMAPTGSRISSADSSPARRPSRRRASSRAWMTARRLGERGA